ncbi:hypothetical protein EV684_11233 [Rubrivivax gelatinosus]|uniref:Uncharacterized protein n=2 Tax=Rubrivivax gelatinosus TaxID=28068 RepID=A0A4R2MD99_RUBGE|nr:hypothetical protein EV684_11233 [Rubrivivax gelatinosus]
MSMEPLDAFWHLLNFVLPALAVAALAAGAAKLLWRRELRTVAWTRLARDAAIANLLVLVAGLVLTRHDGRILTYAAMVLACAIALWWRGFGPGRR